MAYLTLSAYGGAHVSQEVDSEVERLVSNAYNLAKDVLIKNKTLLYALADRLVRRDVSVLRQ